MSDNWILLAVNDNKNYVAQTTAKDSHTLYRALSKWIIRGSASKILKCFWEYMDQDDNEVEGALLEQLETQGEQDTTDPQITNVRTKDYSIDMIVTKNASSETVKKCTINFVLYVYFHSLKKKVRIDEQNIEVTLLKTSKMEQLDITTPHKTPGRVSKRSSKTV